MHAIACQRIPVAKVASLIPARYFEAMEHNQLLPSCCRHPENHEIEAGYSTAAEAANGIPDIYVFHCTCGKRHTRLCCGGNLMAGAEIIARDERPFWEIR